MRFNDSDAASIFGALMLMSLFLVTTGVTYVFVASIGWFVSLVVSVGSGLFVVALGVKFLDKYVSFADEE
jgi:hypothetical protein